MFFRNLLIYRLTQSIDLSAETLEMALVAKPARACASQELATYGFAAPIGKGEDAPLVHASSGFLLIATRKEERILPGSVIRDALQEKVEEIEAEQMRKVYKKERDRLKEDIIQTLLPRAFIRRATTFAAIMPAQGLILVNTPSAKKAEDLLSTLRECIGSLPVRPVSMRCGPSVSLTAWVKKQQTPNGFHLLDRATLCDTTEGGGKIAATGQDLTSDEMRNHLDAGKQVTQIALAWQDKLSFVLDDMLVIRRLRFEDLLHEQAAQDGGDDALAQLDASFTLMMLTFREFLPALIEALGGEEIPQGIDGPIQVDAPSSNANGGIDVTRLLGLKDGVTATLHLPDEAPGEGFGDASDPLYAEAIAFVRESGQASISALQRRLKLGYNRAARLIETMERSGIVSAMNRDGSRKVLATGGSV